jgi:mannose-6-phosphate isomerase-like protein (cupin superfamily)
MRTLRTRSIAPTWAAALIAAVPVAAVLFALSRPGLAADNAPPAAAGAVTYFRAEAVAKSFEQGAVLFDRGTNYMIHTSRRVVPGKAEIHTKDTDLIYVLDGTATFVTGGRVPDAAPIAPDEIRGSGIEGGETRILSKGDVIIVPAGTPHWFQEVRGPLLYYTIKVR